jgi:uncharacterized membrane protein YcaP (DUF421 family)
MEELMGIALRATVMYLYALTLVRLSGKRTLGSLSGHDFVITLAIGDIFDDVLWAEVSLAQGLTAFGVIALTHLMVSYADWKSKPLKDLLDGAPTTLLREKRFLGKSLRKERMTEADVLALLREQSTEKPGEVQEARLEPSGRLSVLRREKVKPAEKRDLPELKEALG